MTGFSATIKDIYTIKYIYGEWYIIEQEIDGKLYEMLTKVKDYGFDSKGYEVDENNEVKFIIDWDWLYWKLPLGEL